MKYINGDLVELFSQRKFDVVVHGCNCFNNMGAGIALQLDKHFDGTPSLADSRTFKGDKNKLGSYTRVIFPCGVLINAYTQYHYGFKTDGKPPCDYTAISDVFDKIKKNYPNAKIGIPKIGAGLAGGDWDKIEKILDDKNMDITTVIYNG